MEPINKKVERWLLGRLDGIQAEIEEINDFLNKYAEDEDFKKKNPEKITRYRVMLACRLHTKQELETMREDLSVLFETE